MSHHAWHQDLRLSRLTHKVSFESAGSGSQGVADDAGGDADGAARASIRRCESLNTGHDITGRAGGQQWHADDRRGMRLLRGCLAACACVSAQGQGACQMGTMARHMTEVSHSPGCQAGCVGADGCVNGLPTSGLDTCNAECAGVYVPFWDECSGLLEAMDTSGVTGIGILSSFYDKCLGAMVAGQTVCADTCGSANDLRCHRQRLHEACCDVGSSDCAADIATMPPKCSVRCSVVALGFVQDCAASLQREGTESLTAAQQFWDTCANREPTIVNGHDADGLGLIEYAVDLRKQGCLLDIPGLTAAAPADPQTGGGTCSWEQLKVRLAELDGTCCSQSSHGGPMPVHFKGGTIPPAGIWLATRVMDKKLCNPGAETTCTAACAVRMNEFVAGCGDKLPADVVGTNKFDAFVGFEEQCELNIDVTAPVILSALLQARCPAGPGGLPVDCAGVPGGPSVEDACGVCNGDSSSCGGTYVPTSTTTNASPVVVTQTTSAHGTTYRLQVSLAANAVNVYAMAGDSMDGLEFPAAFHCDPPFGADVAGVAPAFFDFMPDCEFDSWLTVGLTEGDSSQLLSSIGLDFSGWSAGQGSLASTNGAVFYMDPMNVDASATNSGQPVTVAQLTVPAGTGFTAHAMLLGKSGGGGVGAPHDWREPRVTWTVL